MTHVYRRLLPGSKPEGWLCEARIGRDVSERIKVFEGGVQMTDTERIVQLESDIVEWRDLALSSARAQTDLLKSCADWQSACEKLQKTMDAVLAIVKPALGGWGEN